VSTESNKARLEQAAQRLEEISAQLGAAETGDEDAVALAREAAEIAAEVGGVAADAAREASESGESA
jgi:division protein CdvB (Snf7/Vps24/ESCRT-III family)